MLATVADEVALSIAVQIEPPRHARSRDGALPHRRMDRLSLPGDIGRKTDVDRQEPRDNRPCHDCASAISIDRKRRAMNDSGLLAA
ncbi:hypothetical protein D3C83_122260 [compost metagenome]